jgi:hypothetical protein
LLPQADPPSLAEITPEDVVMPRLRYIDFFRDDGASAAIS